MTSKNPIYILSVIIVTFKSENEIEQCINSIPRFINGRPVEIIVVENCSGDRTPEIVIGKFPNVRFIPLESNLGFGKANNIGYEFCQGEFILFLNPDTISNEVVYTHCISRLTAEANIGVISPKLVMLDGEMDLACRRSIPTVWDGFCRALGISSILSGVPIFTGYNLTHLPPNETYDVGSVNGAFMLCPHSVLLRVGVFDEQFFMYGDDLDLNYRIKKAGYRVVYDGRVEMIHIKGVSSSKDANNMAKAVFNSTKQFYLKHFNPHNSIFVSAKYGILFYLWERLSKFKAIFSGYRKARPL